MVFGDGSVRSISHDINLKTRRVWASNWPNGRVRHTDGPAFPSYIALASAPPLS